jgi:hydrogenase expression/formation protein HypE
MPLPGSDAVTLAHGAGGRAMHDLIDTVFLKAFNSPALDAKHDGAIIRFGETTLAFTTDSYVVSPLFFPGGDIGSLAVYGTVNDLAMCGARPLHLSAGFILEEGLPTEALQRVVQSMADAAHRAGVSIITGDTKVVDKGKGDGIYVNTAGIGIVQTPRAVLPQAVRTGDAILLSGDIGRHGIAVMAARAGLQFEHPLASDLAPLADLVMELVRAGIEIHCLRDLTRGGLASALNEIAAGAHLGIVVREADIPVREEVRGACELLGFDPLYVACEGRFIAFVPPTHAARALEVLHADPLGCEAARIGTLTDQPLPPVSLETVLGVSRVLDMLTGEQLPRIC